MKKSNGSDDMKHNKEANKLINEKSPYLLQHAYNPVDWYPWCEEAFKKAQEEDKPIFLSIGYSTCHWCHVMERESFEDSEIGDLLNEHFISIKVDREERPDIDSVYMEVAHALHGSGGWPLTIIMTPDQLPFFAGTYIPKEGNEQFKGLIELLTIIETKWKVNKQEIIYQGQKVKDYFNVYRTQKSTSNINDEILEKTYLKLEDSFDAINGGFGKAPKFPTPHTLMFLLRYSMMKSDSRALEMFNKTLYGMYKGGMYDHLGFGFSRYSTDQRWLVPHFEKMLYDNALLAIVYIEGYLHTKDPLYRKVAEEILEFVEEDMMDPNGGFYTAIDADSEGIEGKFYVWTPNQIDQVLLSDESEFIKSYYQITEEGNFEDHHILNLLHMDDTNLFLSETEEVKNIKHKLFTVREERVKPHLDDKILTSLNGMMIVAFALAYKSFGDDKYRKIAEKSMNFILNELVNEEERLLSRYRDGEAKYHAYLEDYAYLEWALIELFLVTGNHIYLDRVMAFNQQMKELFYDGENGGFYQTAHDHESLLFRNKETYDGATPSANSIIAMNLIRLAEIVDAPSLEKLARQQFKTFADEINQSPTAFTYMVTAYMMHKVPKRKIVLVTDEITDDIKQLQRIVHEKCVPCTSMITLLRDEINESEYFSYYLEDLNPKALHICENYACNDPIYDIEEMREELNNLIISRIK